jgi:hypothetical protein
LYEDLLNKPTFENKVDIPELDTNGHAYVDLGLPSGTLWSPFNLGATAEMERGDYYAISGQNYVLDWKEDPAN